MTWIPEVQLAGTMTAEGYSYAELAQLARRGHLSRVRHGAYVGKAATDPLAQHRQLIAGTVPRLAPGAVISHSSAALLHGLPTWTDELQRVHVVRHDRTSGHRTRWVHTHAGPLPHDELVELNGLLVTSVARTTADVARTSSYERAVICGDAALRLGLERAELEQCIGRPPRRVGDPQARRVAGFVDARAESGGESMSRIVLHRLGLPTPQPQLEVIDPASGQVVARCDFGWLEHRTLGEFDGKQKYGRLLKAGESAGDAVFREKRREDLLRDLGWEVVRWIWAELYRPDLIAERLYRAFARGARRR